MFATARLYAVLAACFATLVVAALLVGVGFAVGRLYVQSDWDRVEKDRAESIVGLAQRHAEADAEAQRLRAAAEAVVEKRVVEVKREIVKIPVRIGCGHSSAEYRLLLDTFCARHATATQCLYHPLPNVGGSDAGAGQSGADGAGSPAH